MVSEEKVKLMTKVAIYESGQGKKDLKIVPFQMSQYVSLETIQALFINTIAFLVVLGCTMLIFINQVILVIEHHRYKRYIFLVLLIYIIFIIIQGLYASQRAKEEYEQSMPRIREYQKYLEDLSYMYKMKEDKQETKTERLEEKLEEEMNADVIEF